LASERPATVASPVQWLAAAADLLARTVVAPAEIPIGIVTALVGAPFFLWLLLRQSHHGGLAR